MKTDTYLTAYQLSMIKLIEYHRNPTKWEIKFGEGALHHINIDVKIVTKKDDTLKKRYKHTDGLIYTL